jgi:ADP-ribose pyrophosphatase
LPEGKNKKSTSKKSRMETPKIIGTKILFDHPGVRILLDTLLIQDQQRPYLYLESPIEAVATLGVNAENEALLTRQYRHPVRQVIYDLPAGRLHPGEAPLAGGRREFEEETGFYPEEMVALGYYNQFPGSMRAGTHLFFGSRLRKTQPHLDEGEILDVVRLPIKAILEMVVSGQVIDGSLQLALLLAIQKGLILP